MLRRGSTSPFRDPERQRSASIFSINKQRNSVFGYTNEEGVNNLKVGETFMSQNDGGGNTNTNKNNTNIITLRYMTSIIRVFRTAIRLRKT